MRNHVLESSERRLTGDTANRAADSAQISDYRAKCRALTGSDQMPPVLYKGRIIEAGTLGERELPQ